jgi:hypothetical protein
MNDGISNKHGMQIINDGKLSNKHGQGGMNDGKPSHKLGRLTDKAGRLTD